MVTTVYCVHLMCFHLAPVVRKMDSAIRYIALQVLLTFLRRIALFMVET